MDEKIDLKSWKKKRKYTLMVYLFQYFLIGVERGANATTLWVYLTTLVKTENPDFIYGLTILIYYVPAILFSMTVARYTDKTRNIKFVLLICNFISMVGCVIYIIPYSSCFVVIGQALLGFTVITRPVTSGEIARLYPVDQIQTKIPILMAGIFLGLPLAPFLAMLFQAFKFSIFGIPITNGNISGLMLFVFLTIGQFCIVLLSHDLSKEYSFEEESGNIQIEGQENKDLSKQTTFYNVLWKTLKSFDIMLIIFLTFYVAFLDIAFCRMIPVIIINSKVLPYYVVTIFFDIYAIGAFLMLFGLTKTKLKDETVYYCSLVSVAAVFISGLSQMLLSNGNVDTSERIIFIVVLAFSITFAEVGEQIFLIVVLSKMVSSQNKSYVESIRSVVKQVGCLSGGFLSAYLARNSTLFFVVISVTCLVIFILLLVRTKSLKYPKIIIT